MKKRVLIFDMDGVLADVRESYLAAIAETTARFTGQKPGLDLIQKYKEKGGWNNDWELTCELIRKEGMSNVSYPEVVAAFQEVFRGRDYDGLILRERWLPQGGLLERLSSQGELAVFSGRPRDEIRFTLRRFVPNIQWAFLIGEEDVTQQKPHPEGLETIARGRIDSELFYIGDSLDDARCARAAGISFIGITGQSSNGFAESLRAEGAAQVLPSVNDLENLWT